MLGAWMTNIILIFFLKFIFGIVPGITPELSWTLTTLTYNIVRLSNKRNAPLSLIVLLLI